MTAERRARRRLRTARRRFYAAEKRTRGHWYGEGERNIGGEEDDDGRVVFLQVFREHSDPAVVRAAVRLHEASERWWAMHGPVVVISVRISRVAQAG